MLSSDLIRENLERSRGARRDTLLLIDSYSEEDRVRRSARAPEAAKEIFGTGRHGLQYAADQRTRHRARPADARRAAGSTRMWVRRRPARSAAEPERASPMDIVRCGPDDGPLIRQVRLRALADAPYAFGRESFAAESALPDGYWHRLAALLGGRIPEWRERCASFVAFDADEASGTVTCFLCPEAPLRAYLSSVWIDPRYRRQGLGRRLVAAVVAWARRRGADHLRLWVDDTNPGAIEFYRALGFTPTGESRPVNEGSPDRQSALERSLRND